MANWQLALQQGLPRNDVVQGFLFSTESLTRLVDSYYSAFLNRPAEPSGMALWLGAVQNHLLDFGQAAQGILASEENFHAGLGSSGGLGGSGSGGTDVPLVPMPTKDNKAVIWTGTKGDPNNVLYNDQSILNLGRTVTITNSDPTHEIFPYFRAANSRAGLDNQDNLNEEYRGYIGFQKTVDGKQVSYFGLLPGEHITINVPLVFWDAGRIYYTADSRFLTNDLSRYAVIQGTVNDINNPYHYYDTDIDQQPTRRYIDAGQGDTTIVGGSAKQPVVLYYHAVSGLDKSGKPLPGALDLVQAAPAGFVELTIRDPAVTRGEQPHMSYDLSFVDTISLPGALQPPKANVPQGDGGYSATNAPLAWVGAPETVDAFQTLVGRFTGNIAAGDTAPNPLGNFFGGKGWPQYYVTPAVSGPTTIQVPATKNVFEQSALLTDSPGPYQDGDNNFVKHYWMATGGIVYETNTGNVNGNGSIKAGTSTITGVDPTVIATLTPGMQIRDAAALGLPVHTLIKAPLGTNSIELTAKATQDSSRAYTFNGSQFAGPDYSGKVDGQAKTLTLDKTAGLVNLQQDMLVTGPGITGPVRIDTISAGVIKLKADAGGAIADGQGPYVFTGGLNDYAPTALLNLWYAWADYYVSYVQGKTTAQEVDNGDIKAFTDTQGITNYPAIQFPSANATAGLYVGMGVSSLDSPTLLPAGTVISGFGSPTDPTDRSFVHLSKSATGAITGGKFAFALPTAIPRTDSLVANSNPDAISLANNATDAQKKTANNFAGIVYAVMKAFSGILGNGSGPTFDSLAFLSNITGGNIAQIPNLGAPGTDPIRSPSGLEVRDQSKSLERGVPDFNEVPPYAWYPNPAVAPDYLLAGASKAAFTFNPYSLDPFVWFVHSYAGVSGYAFSLDDDAANPTVNGAQTIDVSFGGITPFTNKAEWSPGAQFGPVPGAIAKAPVNGSVDQATKKITITRDTGNKLTDPFNYLTNPPPGASNGALVIGPGIGVAPQDVQALARVAASGVNTGAATVQLIGGALTNASGNYVFFGPVHFTGTIDPMGTPNKITNLNNDDLSVLKALTANQADLSALWVTGPGVQALTHVQAIGLDNSILLDAAHPLDPMGPKGEFRFGII
jgi:hypothetical protein